jgi:hypothetical protein
VDLELNVAAMASIVHDLLADGVSLLESAQWLLDRATAAKLRASEYEALESLRLRLLSSRATLLDGVSNLFW